MGREGRRSIARVRQLRGRYSALWAFAWLFSVVPCLAQTDVGGLICSDTIWDSAGSPYTVTNSIIIGCGATLTVDPGVRICFPRGLLGLAVGSGTFGEGTLVARGTPDAPIIFTSCEPDAQPGDWVSINFTDASVDAAFDVDGNYVSGSILEHVVVEFAGAGGTDGAVIASLSSPFIARSIIRNNTASGVFVEGDFIRPSMIPPIRIEGNTISGNTASAYYGGGGVWLYRSDSATLTGNTISGNNASTYYGGGGVMLHYSHSATLTGNTISGNTASGYRGGGGVKLSSSRSATLTGNTISGNTAYGPNGGGGVLLYYSDSATLTGNVILRNRGHRGGGLFFLESNDFTVRDCVLANNTATSAGEAGGIGIENSPGLTLTGAVVLLGNAGFDIVNDNAFGPIDNDVVAEGVWWGTSDTAAIGNRIWDFFDDATKAIVDWDPPAATGTFDFTGDGEILLDDFPGFVNCVSGPGQTAGASCALGDLDRDGDVDLLDFAAYQTVMGGP